MAERQRWKDVRLSISNSWEKMEGHMTFHLERKIQNPSTMRQVGVAAGKMGDKQKTPIVVRCD